MSITRLLSVFRRRSPGSRGAGRPVRPGSRPRLEVLEDRTVPAILQQPGFVEETFAAGLAAPTAMEFAPDGRLFVAEKGGPLRVVLPDGTLLPTPFLSVPVNTASERGLIGVTLDPNFASNGLVYVYYTTNDSTPINRLSRFTVDPSNPNVALAGSETILIDNIPSTNGNHNGGGLHFGNDGKLYIGVGESGVPSNSQTTSNLAGKVLRVNADGSVPTDNPFENEIWALGFRNPFTFAVDPVTGRIFVNDVGAGTFEEVDELVRGGNYGWPTAEGPSGNPSFIDPVHAYAHQGAGAAIAGGVFYRASQFPSSFQGAYFFGDFVRGFIRFLTPGDLQSVSFATNAGSPVDLDLGADGSLYYLSIGDGTVTRVRFVGPDAGAGGGRVFVASVAAGAGPHVRVFDADTGAERLSFFAYDPSFTGGVRVATGDLTGDGVPDIITGAGPGAPGGHVKVFDGRTGTEIRSFLAFPGFVGGVNVAAGDINNDGIDDIVVGADTGAPGGHVKVFDGRTGSLLQSFFAYDVSFTGGVRVAVGDINGDGVLDIITGAGPGGPPHVRAFDGQTLALRASFFAYGIGYVGGLFVGTGDIGDGRAEIITGTASGNTHVKAFDVVNGIEKASFFAYGSFAGGVRVATADADGDGVQEILTATGPGAAHVKAFRAGSLEVLDSFFAFPAAFTGGLFIAGV
jgi:glucose/arabinose dehydrogenase